MSPRVRSAVLAVIGGMMAAAYLHGEGVVDLSYGFPRGGLAEGVLMGATGIVAGLAILLAFRVLRDLVARARK